MMSSEIDDCFKACDKTENCRRLAVIVSSNDTNQLECVGDTNPEESSTTFTLSEFGTAYVKWREIRTRAKPEITVCAIMSLLLLLML